MTYPPATNSSLIEQTSRLVIAYVASNAVPMSVLPGLIEIIHVTIAKLPATVETMLVEPMPTEGEKRASVRHESLLSFIDGRPYKTLKRHLTKHGLTPERYRDRYGLAADYPMIAPGYSARRSNIAKLIMLGHKIV